MVKEAKSEEGTDDTNDRQGSLLPLSNQQEDNFNFCHDSCSLVETMALFTNHIEDLVEVVENQRDLLFSQGSEQQSIILAF